MTFRRRHVTIIKCKIIVSSVTLYKERKVLNCPWQRRLLDIAPMSKSVREHSIIRSGLHMQTLL